MKKSFSFLSCVAVLLLLGACASSQSTPSALDAKETSATPSGLLQVVATTTMLHDLCQVVGGDQVVSTGLLGVGVDPHVYKPSARDTSVLEDAQVILYHGLHLEAQMEPIFESMASRGKDIIAIEGAIDSPSLLTDTEDMASPDPHIWFDPHLWMMASRYLAEELGQIDPDHADYYMDNAETYILELEALDLYIQERIQEIPAESRVLVTAHDAFQYFGACYDFQVMGIQGIATNSEATTSDLRDLADFIVDRQLKAVFVETSVSSKNMEALQEAVAAQGFQVSLGGALYSDSLGEGEHNSYLSTYRSNIDTIVNALSQ